ncbi:MAG: hypothetical protein O3A92_04485 [Verrucomicrobia bacterium]|nr:hypothetical protein [Verrucomicrobiota bacterium]
MWLTLLQAKAEGKVEIGAEVGAMRWTGNSASRMALPGEWMVEEQGYGRAGS